MSLKIFEQQIRRAFSNSAIHYEVLSSMQYEIGRELINHIDFREEQGRMLDIGMGTGKLTNRLATHFPGVQVVGLDFADGMVETARKTYETFQVVQANASKLPFSDGQFDAAISNLAYQWVADLSEAFGEARRVLKDDGQFQATLFGRETLRELFTALEMVSREGKNYQRLASMEAVHAALRTAGFDEISVSNEIIKTHFDNLHALLKWLKTIGANGINREYLGPRQLERAAECYEKNFSGRWGVTASFEVIWVKGRKTKR